MSNSAISCVRKSLKDYLVHNELRPWLDEKAPRQYEPFYASVDIRDAGFKLAPVDANFFPAGFNNICKEDLENSPEILKQTLQRHLGGIPKQVAILPEGHTKNKFYVDNLLTLRSMFRNAGIKTEIGWWDEQNLDQSGQPPIELLSSSDQSVQAFPFYRDGNTVKIEPFEPEFILLNNDFSALKPKGLEGIDQPVEPSYKLGWHTRKKSDFFSNYNYLASELAKAVKIDPWCLSVLTERVDDVDFQEKRGLDRIAEKVESVLNKIKSEYDARGIDEKPFAFVKNNAGTYGIGILRVESVDDVLEMNRRERNKMSVGKGKRQIQNVVIQEGVYTRFDVDGAPAEPTIALLGYDLVGGFLRMNPERGRTDNLNARGMMFKKLCISDLRKPTNRDVELELVYGTIAQLSVAAMALEVKKVGGIS